MKIKKSLVEQIIREESLKIKKIITLNEEKKVILKQLNELYKEEDMEEGFFSRKTPDEKKQDILAKVTRHPALNGEYKRATAGIDGRTEDIFLSYLMNHPDKLQYPYFKWDKINRVYVDAADHSDASGILGPFNENTKS